MKRIPPKFQFLAVQFLLVLSLSAQNLVPNYSFETYSSCPTNPDQLYLLDDWYKPTNFSTDFFNSCYVPPSTWSVDVPDNFVGFQETVTGEGYAGIVTYVGGGNTWKEYLQVLLTEPLIAGECYEVEMFSSLAEASDWGNNGLGIYLSDTPPPLAPDGHIYLTPQFYHSDVQLDTENWVSLNGAYTATGGEQYLTIGLFFEYGTFDVEPLIPPGLFQNIAYYYIEDVSVELNTIEEEIEAEICEGECYEYGGEQYCEVGVYEIPVEGLCFSTVTLTINPAEIAIATIAPPETLNCTINSVILDGSGSSSGPGVYYEWTGPGNYSSSLQSPLVFEPGVYTLIVSGDFLCSATISIELFQDITPPDISAEVSGDINCFNPIVILAGTSNTPNVIYQWIGPGVDSNDPLVIATDPGTFIFTVTAENGCTSSEEITVIEDIEIPDISAEVLGILDCNTSSVVLSGNSETPDVTYIWSGPGIDVNLPVTNTDQAGEYTFVVIAPNGCVSIANVTVMEEETVLDIDAVVDGVINCLDSTVTLTGNTTVPDVTYEWFGPGVNVDSAIVEVSIPGDYTFSIMTDSGCSADTTISVEQNIQQPEIMISPPDTINCNILSVELDGSASTGAGILSFEWQNLDGNILGIDTFLTVDSAATYTLILTDEVNGCTAITTVLVDEDIAVPDALASSNGVITCDENSTVILDGSGSTGNGTLEYEWFDSDNNSLEVDTILIVDSTGMYFLVITDTENSCTDQTSIVVEEDLEAPNPEATSSGFIDCLNSEVTLDGSNSSGNGNLDFEWLNENDATIGIGSTVDVDTVGEFTLIITDNSNACTAEISLIVDEDTTQPQPDVTVDGDLTCVDELVILDGGNSSGGGTIIFQWQDSSGSDLGTDAQQEVDDTGIFTLIITDSSNGCTAETTIEVFDDLASPSADAGSDASLTCDATSVQLDGSGSDSGTNITYEWLNEGGVPVGDQITIDVSEIGIYTLIVTNEDNGCSSSANVEVTPDTDLPIADPGTVQTLTCSDIMVTLDGSGSDNGTNITYEWFDPSNTSLGDSLLIDVNTAGTYTLIVSNEDNGCSSSSTVLVGENMEEPIADAGTNGLLTCDVSSWILDSGNSSGGTLSFEWQDELGNIIENNGSTEISTAGIYILIVTNDDNGCTATDIVQVNEDYEAPIAIGNPDAQLTCINNDVVLSGLGSTGNGNLSYEWFDQNNGSLGTTIDLTVSLPDTYVLVVTDESNGCTTTTDVIVLQDINLPSANAGANATLTCDISEATLTGSGSTNSGNINYEWQTSSGVVLGNSASLIIFQTGNYTLIVTDPDNGCTTTSDVEVTSEANLPVADAGLSSTLTCTDIEAILDGSASSSGLNYSYEWQNAVGDQIDNIQNPTVSSSGVYTLIVTDNDNGCSSSAFVEIFENIETPIADAGLSPTLTCDITTATIDGSASSISSGTLSFEWTNPDGNVIGNNNTVVVDAIGIYDLLVTAENGCTSTAQVEVFLDGNVPIADVGPGGILDCETTTITLGGAGTSAGLNITYEWLDENNTVIATTPTTNISAPGSYTLIIFNTDNDCETSAFIEIAQDIESPQADAGLSGMLTCTNSMIEIGGAGTSLGINYSYEWFDSNNNLLGTENLLDVNLPDSYTLIVMNTVNHCTSEASVVIDQDIESPVADAGQGGILNCNIAEITLDGSNSTGNNLTYEWMDENGIVIGDQPVIQVSQVGDYTLLVTNNTNGCTAVSSVTVTTDANLPTAITSNDGILTCINNSVLMDGSASYSESGNIGFQWFDTFGNLLSTTNNYTSSLPGSYLLIVTDLDNGCTGSITEFVGQDISNPMADAGPNQLLTCDLTQTTLIGTGSSGNNLSYQWLDDNNNILSNTLSVIVDIIGTYTFMVTNEDNGCTALSDVVVNLDTNFPTADAGIGETLTCTVLDITLDGSASSTGPEIDYEWQDESGSMISNLISVIITQPGTYTLIVSNNLNGCSAMDEIIVLQDINPPIAIIDESSALNIDCNNASFILDGNGSFPNGNLTYLWTSIDGNILSDEDSPNPEVDTSGTYTLTVTNQINGCTHSASITVAEDLEDPVAIINNPELLTCAQVEIFLDASGSSSNGDFSYSWSSVPAGGVIANGNTLQPTVNQLGTYTITVLNNENGCETETQIFVDQDNATPLAFASVSEEFDCVTETITLDGSGSSEGSEFIYNWSGFGIIDNVNSLSPTVYQSGNYTLLVTDLNNGCTSSAVITVTEHTNVPTAFIYELIPPPCFGDGGSFEIISTLGGEPPFLYSIDGGENFSAQTSFSGLVPGDYLIIVQDITGCEYEEWISIPEPIELQIDLEIEVVLNLGEPYQLNALPTIPIDEIDTIIWSPSDGLSCLNCLNPQVDPLTEMVQYFITVINLNGCQSTAGISLRIHKTREIFIPNVFSPVNQDGINDLFMIYANNDKVKEINTFRIFDRWGEVVFQANHFRANDPSYGWDGRFINEALNPGVFVYFAEIEFIDGVRKIYSGDVTLVD